MIFFMLLLSIVCAQPLVARTIITTGAPKSGISMLTDILKKITHTKHVATIPGEVLLQESQLQRLGNDIDILVGTPVCNEHNRQLLAHYPAKIIYIMRDPRDQLASTARTIYNHKRHVPAAHNKDIDTILSELIEAGGNYYTTQYPYEELYNLRGIVDLYTLWTPWKDEPYVLVVSFEKLSGTRTERINEYQRIANFLEIELSPSTINSLLENKSSSWFGFGKKEPKPGAWKSLFKPHHVQRFNELAQPLCTELGYEI